MLAVGKALKAHGIRGDVKAESYMDAPDLFSKIKTLYVGGKPYTVEKARAMGNFVLIKFKDVDTMNAAEAFRNRELFAKKEDLPKPKEGRYYIDDLIGCATSDGDGQFLGTVSDVYQYGSADVYVLEYKGKTVMFPFVDGVVLNVDTDNKKITVDGKEFEKVAVYED